MLFLNIFKLGKKKNERKSSKVKILSSIEKDMDKKNEMTLDFDWKHSVFIEYFLNFISENSNFMFMCGLNYKYTPDSNSLIIWIRNLENIPVILVSTNDSIYACLKKDKNFKPSDRTEVFVDRKKVWLKGTRDMYIQEIIIKSIELIKTRYNEMGVE